MFIEVIIHSLWHDSGNVTASLHVAFIFLFQYSNIPIFQYYTTLHTNLKAKGSLHLPSVSSSDNIFSWIKLSLYNRFQLNSSFLCHIAQHGTAWIYTILHAAWYFNKCMCNLISRICRLNQEESGIIPLIHYSGLFISEWELTFHSMR